MKIQVLSPDGITIEFDKWTYPSMKKAKEAFNKWKKRYEVQGFYSANYGRISLSDLEQHCQFKII